MDPTAVLPPSPEKSPPPQNPHSATDAIIDAAAFDRHQKAEPSTSRNMDSFRSLVMKLAGRLLPAHKSLIGRRFDDIFPDELLAPDHPPYADMLRDILSWFGGWRKVIGDIEQMILTALWELNTEGGSSKEAISDFIEKEYHELPWAHATMINHHLRDLCKKGKIVMTRDRFYLRCSSITKPEPSPYHILCLNDDSSCSSSISSPYSSSSASLCSSPSSSSSSFCSGPPYKRRKRQLKRKRKNIKKTGCKMVQGRGKGRGRGRGRQPRTIQVGKRGGPLGVNQARKRSRPVNEIKIGEKSQMEEEQVDEDRNEVMGMEVEEDAIQDEQHYDVVRINQQAEEDGAGKQQNQPQKRYSVTWIGRGEHIHGKGECVKQRQPGSKQHVSKRPFQPCEQLEKGINEKGHQRKQDNVVWIGRGVRKLKGAGKNLPEAESDEKVTELEDYAGEDAVMINCDAEVDEHVEQLKPKEEKGAINVEHNRPEENQQSDIVEKQFLDKEQITSVTDDKSLPCIQQERVDSEAELEVLPEALQVDDRVKEGQYLLMARTDEQEVGVIKEWSGKQNQGEGESMEQIGSQLQQNDLSEEQVDLQKPSKEENDNNFHTQGQPQRGSMEQDQLQKQGDQLGDERNSVMMHCEGQVTDASVEKQHEIEEQIRPQEQPKKGTEEKFETPEKQNDGGTEQKMLEIQVQVVGKPLQDEDIQKGRVLIDEERDALMVQYEVQARVETVEKTEPEEQHNCLIEEQVDTKEQSKEHDDVTEEPIHSQEKCIERNEEEIQFCVTDWLKNGEAESAEEQPQQEEQTEVNQKETGLAMDSEVLQDLRMNQGDGEEHNKSKVYQDQLEKRETLTSQVQPQHDGQHKKVLQEESELMNNKTAVKQDFMMIESGSQFETTSLEHNEVQEDDTVVGLVQPQKQLMEGTNEGQKDENEAGFEKNQSEELENGVTIQRYQPQEQCVERIEELSQPCIQQTEPSEKDEKLASSSSTIEVSKSLGVAKVNLPDHKHKGEQRRPLRQGLRSSCKKEEATKKAKNKLEQVTPVRRSLRPRKTISEATVVIENSPDRSKEQLKHSRRARPSKRKPGIAEAEQASKSQKTRRTDL